MKKLLIIGIVAILVFGIGAFMIFNKSNSNPTGLTISDKGIKSLSTEERYVKFESELVCGLMKTGSEPMGALELTTTLAKKYSITEQDIKNIQAEVEKSTSLSQKITTEVQRICPEDLARVQTNGN
jgi:hypothetical protein